MPITIQEIIASDTISQFVDKTNFNFDQLLLNGGGPIGPTGSSGPTGPGGGRGTKGTTWYEDNATSTPGTIPTSIFPTATPLDKDYYLQFNGQVWEYNGTTAVWESTTINLQGPQGSAGGGGGGFGLTAGAPIFNQQNIRYNGPIGLNDGATASNEGVPSIMIGGVTSNTTPLTGIPFTGAYFIPDAIIVGNSSPQTSLLIHQRDSSARGIVFHGGDATGNADKFEQADPSVLSNVSIGIDDKLILNVPKIPTSPAAQVDMRGIELITPTRSQYFYAGADMLFQSGVGPATPLFAGQHSNFEINVSTGGSSGAGNIFKTITAGTIGSTLLEAGNSSNITLVTAQEIQTGNWQVQAGEIRMVSSTTKNLRLYSGGDVKLNTKRSGGSNSGTGAIALESGIGGISLSAVNGGDINIQQLTTVPTTFTTGRNITITNAGTASTAALPLTQTISQTTLGSNTQIILRKTNATAIIKPSITLDYNYYQTNPVTPSQPPPPIPHTRFVGMQTWAKSDLAFAVTPDLNGNFTGVVSANPQQFNYLNSTLVSASSIFRQSGGNTLTDIAAGARFETWEGGTQAGGPNDGYPAGAIQILQGNEIFLSGAPKEPWPYLTGYDKTIGINIQNNSFPASGELINYFSANSDKTAIGNPFIYNRTQIPYPGISFPTGTVALNGNAQPYGEISTSISSGPGVAEYIANTPVWGFDYRSTTIPASDTASDFGMPTTDDLTSPYITLKFGIGVGNRNGAATTTWNFESPATVGVDNSFNFPPGLYPGQRLTVRIENYAVRGALTPPTPGQVVWFGNIRINFPANRTAATLGGLSTDANADWYNTGGVATNADYNVKNTGTTAPNRRRNFFQIEVESEEDAGGSFNKDATNCVTVSKTIDIIWDGGVTQVWGANSNLGTVAAPLNVINPVFQQTGWCIATESSDDSLQRYARTTYAI